MEALGNTAFIPPTEGMDDIVGLTSKAPSKFSVDPEEDEGGGVVTGIAANTPQPKQPKERSMTLMEHIALASPTARPIVGATRAAGAQWIKNYMENIRQRFIM
eukprot:571708-Prorocentrum_lima.AAC.1